MMGAGLAGRVFLALSLVVWAVAAPALAEPGRGKASARRGAGVGAARRVRQPPPRRPPPQPAAPAASGETEAIRDVAAPAAQAAGTRVSKPRVYTFGGLDVEGKLKAPQLLYFRSRMRQELDTSNSESRSFLKELERTADEKGL